MLNDSRLPEHDGRIVGNILENDAIGANPRVVANTNTAEDLCTRPYVDVVPNYGRKPAVTTNGHLVRDDNVLANLRPPR